MQQKELSLISEGIRSRSKWISRKFSFLQYDDLIQEGELCLLKLVARDSCVEFGFVMKAINNLYSKVLKRAIFVAKKVVSLDEINEQELSNDFTKEIESKLDKGNSRLYLSGDSREAQEIMTIFDLAGKGFSLKEIEEIGDIDRRDMRGKGREVAHEL